MRVGLKPPSNPDHQLRATPMRVPITPPFLEKQSTMPTLCRCARFTQRSAARCWSQLLFGFSFTQKNDDAKS